MLYPSPETLTADAAARLATISDNTELGSGFRVAMRDLEIRGAGNLLGDEQSGLVAAVGFELYCQMLEDAAEAMRAGEEISDDVEAAEEREPVRIEVDVDAYLPADYVPFEEAKIDIHRRVAAARERAELRALREELEDRFGQLPAPVENLLELQRARIELGAAGVRTVEFRAGKLRAHPLELESDQAAALRERLPEVVYQWREQTAAIAVPDEPGARLASLLALVDALADLPALARA
jgi:transcription-repair coupling factor (superfamily II helicase)